MLSTCPSSLVTVEVIIDLFKKQGNIGEKPQWIIRCQLFVKSRGVLQDKRYLIQHK